MTLADVYRALRVGPVDERRGLAIVAEAMPHAVATLGLPVGTRLPVSPKLVTPEMARGGSIIPAWPIRQADGGVVIEHVADWGGLLAGFVAALRVEQSAVPDLAQRTWIGIANDVLQLFVADPPSGSYSMVRHHALMLAAATAWLGPAAVTAWRAAHNLAAAAFIRSSDRPLDEAIAAAEAGLQTLLDDERAHLPAARTVDWLDADSAARHLYVNYLGAASLGVAAVLDTMPASVADQAAWLTHAVKEQHRDPEFNRVWIEKRALARGGSPG